MTGAERKGSNGDTIMGKPRVKNPPQWFGVVACHYTFMYLHLLYLGGKNVV